MTASIEVSPERRVPVRTDSGQRSDNKRVLREVRDAECRALQGGVRWDAAESE